MNFLGHMLQTTHALPASTYVLYQPAHGKRRGRPQLNYVNYINKDWWTRGGVTRPWSLASTCDPQPPD